MKKSQFSRFSVFAVATFLVASATSYTRGNPRCEYEAKVCDFPIGTDTVCVNGVGSNSQMASEVGRSYAKTDDPCGWEWSKVWWGWIPTGQHCGYAVTADCH